MLLTASIAIFVYDKTQKLSCSFGTIYVKGVAQKRRFEITLFIRIPMIL